MVEDCFFNCNATANNITVLINNAFVAGGGIKATNSKVELNSAVVSGNAATNGGGVRIIFFYYYYNYYDIQFTFWNNERLPDFILTNIHRNNIYNNNIIYFDEIYVVHNEASLRAGII